MVIEPASVAAGERFRSGVCIVGSGPAGMVLAKKLAEQSTDVVVLESGGRGFDADAQELCAGTIVSRDGYPPDLLMTSRRRQFGGTAHLWNDELDEGHGDELVRLVPLDPIDFEPRSWVPHSGWPFTRSQLEPFYQTALELAAAKAPGVKPEISTSSAAGLFDARARLRTVMSQFGARRVFTHDLPAELAKAENIRLFMNATLLELVQDGTTIRQARVALADRGEITVAADIFVLATGGIENARLLLSSNRIQPNGLGNGRDLVGRFFMDHPSFRLGVLTPVNRQMFRSLGLYDHHLAAGLPVMGKLTFDEQTMRHEQMLNICVTLTPRSRGYESPATKIVKRIRDCDSPSDAVELLRHQLPVLAGAWDELLVRSYERLSNRQLRYFEHKGGWSRLRRLERRFRRFELGCLAEQAPHPENRVKLGSRRDRLGQPMVELHWRWSHLDLASIHRAEHILKEEIDRQKLGAFQGQQELDTNGPPRFASPHHHIGTTRMHSDPSQGVVDQNCKVHQLTNLYVTGSSVFPTGGFANPTLTIIALALRLSYHLRELMKPLLSSGSGAVASRDPSEERHSG